MDGWRSLIFSQHCPGRLMVCPHTSLSPFAVLGLAARSSSSSGAPRSIFTLYTKKSSFRVHLSVHLSAISPFFHSPSVYRPLSVTLPPVVWRLRRGAQSWLPHWRPWLLRRRAPTTEQWPLGLAATQERDQQYNYHITQVLMTQCSHKGPVMQSRTRLVRVSETSISHPARKSCHSQNARSPRVIKRNV